MISSWPYAEKEVFYVFLIQEWLSDCLEKQQQEQALQRYLSQVDELDQWILSTRSTLSTNLQDSDMDEQLSDCQVSESSTGHIYYNLGKKM